MQKQEEGESEHAQAAKAHLVQLLQADYSWQERLLLGRTGFFP